MLLRSTTLVVLLAAIGCGGGGGEKNVGPSVATTVAAHSSTTLTAVAGTAVSPAPSIVVNDQNGAPMSGVPVTFAVQSGGGSVTGASVVTDASGIATVGSWTLGGVAGANSLSATVAALNPVIFSATGTVGAAGSLTKTAGDNQSGAPGTPVQVPPSVTVKDANGNPKSGVAVTFAVASGGGSVTGASATSNAAGVATVGSWTLGAAPGTNTLTASAVGVAPVTFTATAVAVSACAARSSHTLGATSSGTLATTDCQLSDGTFVDFFSTTLGEANAYFFRESSVFDAYLYLATPDGGVIAENDDENASTTNAGIKALLPAGSYLLGASSFDANVTGDYTVSSTTTSTAVTGCEAVFVVKNVSTTQNVEAGDCLRSAAGAPPIYGDGFFIFLRAGQSMTVAMTSTQVDSYLEVVRLDGALVASNDNKDASTKDAQITYTATTSTYYAIFARTAGSSQTGGYTLSIQ